MRRFNYVSPGKETPDDWNDAIGLVPFADYLNHADNTARRCLFGVLYALQLGLIHTVTLVTLSPMEICLHPKPQLVW